MTAFVDWASGRFHVGQEHAIHGGKVITIDAQGVIEKLQERRRKLTGSSESDVYVRTVGDAIEFSGNPTKFLLGHNLYGHVNIPFTLCLFAFSICCKLDIEPPPEDFAAWFMGDIHLTRLDVTRMYRPDWAPPGWVSTWMSVASTNLKAEQQMVTPSSAYSGQTMYVGQHSRRISTKLYDKAAEFKRHPPTWPETDSKEGWTAELERLTDYARDTLRVEVTLRSMGLKDRGVDRAAAWSPQVADAMIDERLAKLSLTEDLRMAEEEVTDLPRRLLGPYTMWREGHDLRTIYKRSQFYEYRRALKPYGIDIAHVQPRVVVTERPYALGRPLKDYIEGPGLSPPQDDPLYDFLMLGT